jgi:hypothetical protein
MKHIETIFGLLHPHNNHILAQHKHIGQTINLYISRFILKVIPP